jgi:ABC-type transport system involved in multi-copper enzyme maturation permease subunit
MNITLLKKELTGLRFCILLIVMLAGMSWTDDLLTGFPDRMLDHDAQEGEGWLIQWLLVGLFIGMTSFNQEREHQTQGFIDGLAVSRLAIFLHKLLAALMVASLCCLLELLRMLVLAGLSVTSVSGPLPWQLHLVECSLALLLGLTVVAVGMLLSFTRKWFPLVAGLLLLALVLLSSSSQSWVVWINSSALVTPTLSESGALIIPWKQVGGFSLLATVTLLLSCLLFCRRDGFISRWFERDFAVWEKLLVGVVVVGVWVTAFSVFVKSQKIDDHNNPVTNSAGVIAATQRDAEIVGFASHETEHYEVIFKESQREEVMKLVGGMDTIYQQVADYFQKPSLPSGRIVLDMSSSIDSHAAGVTNWTKIRVPMAKGEGRLDTMQVLRHETAHVFIEQISDGKASAYFNALRAFHEGVATAVELSSDDEATGAARLKMERWAALANARGKVPLALLCDDVALKEEFDDALVYPLGYVFAKSLVEVGGPQLPVRFLEALKNTPPPLKADSTTLWQHILQECGTSYETVISTYAERLALLTSREQSYIAGFPRLSAKVTVEGEDIVIRLNDFSGQANDVKPICLVAKSMGITNVNEHIRRSTDGSFRLKRSQHSGNELRYMLGWISKDMRYPVLEPWTKVSLK